MTQNSANFSTTPNSAPGTTPALLRIARQKGREKTVPLSLGNNTLSASRPENKAKTNTLDTWDLLRRAKALAEYGARVRICQTVRWDNYKTARSVEIKKAVTGKHNYGNIYCCKNVWGCPMCAKRTARKRGMDVLKAMRKHHENGGVTYMVTYTLKHQRDTRLLWLVQTLREGTRKLKSGRWYQDQKQNIIGTISGLEVTYGENGFHPHLHELLFARGPLTESDIDSWKNKFRAKIESLGGYVGTAGIKIQECEPSEMVAMYIAKSGLGEMGGVDHLKKVGKISKPGIDFEVTGEQTKNGKNGGLNQWEILALTNPWEPLDKQNEYCALWQEYARVLKGRRRLVWSRGVKMELLGEVDDLIDDVEPMEHVGTITPEQYKELTKYHIENEFLKYVDEHGFPEAMTKYFSPPGGKRHRPAPS